MDFIIEHLEIIVGIVGGVAFGGIMLATNSKGGENDLTHLYIKYKKHSDNINKSSKTVL